MCVRGCGCGWMGVSDSVYFLVLNNHKHSRTHTIIHIHIGKYLNDKDNRKNVSDDEDDCDDGTDGDDGDDDDDNNNNADDDGNGVDEDDGDDEGDLAR